MAGPIRDLEDLRRAGARVHFACLDRNCGCAASREVSDIESICLRRGWSTLWDRVASHFRCPRCGSKAITLSADFTNPTPRRKPQLVSIFEIKPKPMPAEQWRDSPINPQIWKRVQEATYIGTSVDDRGVKYDCRPGFVQGLARAKLFELGRQDDPHDLLLRLALDQGVRDMPPGRDTGIAAADYEARIAVEASRPEGVCGRAWRRTKSDAERAWLIDRAKRRWGGV